MPADDGDPRASLPPFARFCMPAGCLLVLATVALLARCGTEGAGAGAGGWEAARDTVGDTVVVRTVAGSEWGEAATLVPELRIGVMEGPEEYILGDVRSIAVDDAGRIFVLDARAPALRVYAADGSYLGTWGREGAGPGEYRRPRAVAVRSDGSVLVRDPGNGRIQVYAPDGEPGATWPIRGNFSTSRPLYVDTADNAYYALLLDPAAELSDWEMGLLRIAPDGTPGDTLRPPSADFEPAFVEAKKEGSWSRSSVPFSPSEGWHYSPLGYFVHGVSTRYALDLHRPDAPVLRIEKAYEPVAVRREEAEARRERIVRNFRENFGTWKWNGPEIPDEKPPFRAFFPDGEGRIWVVLSTPGVEEENPAWDPAEEGSSPTVWTEPPAFDVFAPDGRYLGRVDAPGGLTVSPLPVARGGELWGVMEDDLGVETVVRFRIERGEGTVAGG